MCLMCFFPLTDLIINSVIGSHRHPFSSLPSGITINIVRTETFFPKFCHCLFHCCCNPCLTAGNLCHSHLTDNTAVGTFPFILYIFLIVDHIAGNLQFMTERGKNPAKIGVVIAINDHTVAVFFLHIFNKFSGKTDFVSTKSKRKKILSLHKELIFIICCSCISQFLERSNEFFQRIFPWSMVQKILHFLLCICLKDKKSRSASTVHNMGSSHILLYNYFFQMRRMVFSDIFQKTEIIFIHKKTNC